MYINLVNYPIDFEISWNTMLYEDSLVKEDPSLTKRLN